MRQIEHQFDVSQIALFLSIFEHCNSVREVKRAESNFFADESCSRSPTPEIYLYFSLVTIQLMCKEHSKGVHNVSLTETQVFKMCDINL